MDEYNSNQTPNETNMEQPMGTPIESQMNQQTPPQPTPGYQRRMEFAQKFKIKQRELMTKLQQFATEFNNSVNKELDVISDDMNMAVDNINRTITNLGQAFNHFNDLQKREQPIQGQTNMFDGTQPPINQPPIEPQSQPIVDNPEYATQSTSNNIQVDLGKEEEKEEQVVLDVNKMD